MRRFLRAAAARARRPRAAAAAEAAVEPLRGGALGRAAAAALDEWHALEAEARVRSTACSTRRTTQASPARRRPTARRSATTSSPPSPTADVWTAVPRALAEHSARLVEGLLVASLDAHAAALRLRPSADVTAVLLAEVRRRLAPGGRVDAAASDAVRKWLHDAPKAQREIASSALRLEVSSASEMRASCCRRSWARGGSPPSREPPPSTGQALLSAVASVARSPSGRGVTSRQAEAAAEVRAWASRKQDGLEVAAQIATAFDAEVQAQRLLLNDAAAAKLKAKVAAAVRRGEEINGAVRALASGTGSCSGGRCGSRCGPVGQRQLADDRHGALHAVQAARRRRPRLRDAHARVRDAAVP